MTYNYSIYQADIHAPYVFMSYNFALEHGFNLEDYKRVWTGTIEAKNLVAALEGLFTMFNVNHPSGYTGRSLSVSDIVCVNGKHYYTEGIFYTRI